MNTVNLTVNGRSTACQVEGRTHLADLLREQLLLTGTHLGCEHGICGACTILVDDRPVRSCITYAGVCSGRRVDTIEAFDDEPLMAMLRDAFSESHALQCGYCTPGMLITARDIVIRHAGTEPSEQTIRYELSGNLCRCTGYAGIVRAVRSVLARVADDSASLPKPPAMLLPALSFEGHVAAPLETLSSASEGSVVSSESSDAGRRIESRFVVDHSADAVWQLVRHDIAATVACLPGAQLDQVGADGAVSGLLEFRLGPIVSRIAGQGRLEYDDQQRLARVNGEGADHRSASRAQGAIEFKVIDASEPGKAQVQVAMDFQLAGALAQFGRSALVDDVVQVVIEQFRGNLERRLAGEQIVAGAGASPLRLVWMAFVRRLRRLFH